MVQLYASRHPREIGGVVAVATPLMDPPAKLARPVPILYIHGALLFGHLSEKIGRRRSIMLALLVSLLSIPAWAFGTSLLALALGSYFMQTGVQGAFGVIPAHLNELSPDAIRSLFPGFVHQLGVLISSPAVSIEYLLRNQFGWRSLSSRVASSWCCCSSSRSAQNDLAATFVCRIRDRSSNTQEVYRRKGRVEAVAQAVATVFPA
jgi:hypothetical protein